MIKRVIDIFASAIALIMFLPMIFIVACFIRFKLGSPVLFRQTRPGQGGKPFEIVKFRTMSNANDELVGCYLMSSG